MRLQHKTVTRIVRYILLFVMPVVLLILFLLRGYETSLRDQVKLRLQAEQERGTAVIANQVENAFSQFVSDLLVVHNSNELAAYRANQNEGTLQEVANLLVRISKQKPYILHQRLLDGQGLLLAQADTNAEGMVRLLDAGYLADSGISEMVQEIQTLSPNVLYISDIIPQNEGNPILTLALPVYQGSRMTGIIAIDYDACYLLSFLSVYQTSLMKDLQFSIIDRQGNIIIEGASDCKNIYAEGMNLFSHTPGMRSQLTGNRIGSYVSEDMAYTFQAIYPASSERLYFSTSNNWLWAVVSSYEHDQLPILTQDFLLSHPSVKFLLSFLVLFVGSVAVVILQIRADDKQQLRISSLIADYASNGVVVYDPEGRVTFCNKAFEELSGYTQEELHGKKEMALRYDLFLSHEQYGESLRPVWVYHESKHRLLCSLDVIHVEGKRWQGDHAIEIYSPSRWNTMELLQLCKKYQIDYHQCFARTILIPEDTGSFVCLQIQLLNSKEIGMRLNQRERVLFSNRFSTTLEKVLDTSFPILIAGFDSYLLFLETKSSAYEIERMVASLLSGFHLPYLFGKSSLVLQLSVGISLYPEPSSSLYALVENAAIAMHMVTPGTEHGYLFYDTQVAMRYARRTAIKDALASVFETDQLYLAYQALVSVKEERIIGAEALIRWSHPELGPIYPDEFLPLVRELQLTELLGRFVIESAISFLHAHWKEIASSIPNFILSINLSADELSNVHLTDLLVSELHKQKIPRSMLEVELTEHTAVESLSNTNAIMDQLHTHGVSLAIDDFGTGFSSLSYLLELPADMIKIDRSFISRYPDSESITIYKTVLLMAKEMGAVVLAEGVETAEQLEFLKIIGCDYYQGYLFSKPVDEATFMKQIKSETV